VLALTGRLQPCDRHHEEEAFMRQIFPVCGLAAVVLTFSVSSARAQTTAVGPYYAEPSWDQTFACTLLSNCPRFIVLANFGGDAVLDRETGLVWERSPSEALVRLDFDPCGERIVGNRQGWRVPTEHELRSLVDPSPDHPSLPAGHPFINIHFSVPAFGLADLYLTTTPDLLNDGYRLLVGFGHPRVAGSSPPSIAFGRAWCVRGK
jgi:hypothetical protein